MCIIIIKMSNHQVSPAVKCKMYKNFPLRRILPRGCANAQPLVFSLSENKKLKLAKSDCYDKIIPYLDQ